MSQNISTREKEIFSQRATGFTRLIMMSSLSLLIFFSPQVAMACGGFISEEVIDGVIHTNTTPIEDCTDPFKVNLIPTTVVFDYSFNSNEVSDLSTLEVAELPVVLSYVPEGEAGNYDTFRSLYKHEGEDYRVIAEGMQGIPEINATGTYSLVTEVFVPISVGMTPKSSPWQRLWNKLVPTAHAQIVIFPFNAERFVLTFTVELLSPPPPAPAGASSVLFLPGIMGSRLYEDGNFCEEDEALGPVRQLWFSTDECKQLRLTTKFTGQSNNTVYTKTGEAGILDDVIIFSNIYDSFLSELENWKDDDIIAGYAVAPYDWRVELGNILKSGKRGDTGNIFAGEEARVVDGYIYNLIKELADSSKNGKVTVVAHSNGGLVIKQLISNLKSTDDPLLDVIDNVILVAVPQLGAPNATIGILHGEDLDPVMSQAVTRRLMNTMPFSHHLLPVTGYFDTVDDAVITIESGEATGAWINTYGTSIATRDDLHDFLSIDSGREKPEINDLKRPEVVDNYLLDYAKTTEVVQNNFSPTVGMKVYQIAGVGLETPTSLVYFSDRECTKRSFFLCTEYSPKISYRVEMTIDGDDTVPVPSALALVEDELVERMWLDLPAYNSAGLFGAANLNRRHKNILEVPDVTDFVSNIVQATNTKTYVYLSDTVPDLDEGKRLVFQLHSPLDMSLVNSNGKIVSSSTNEIKGSVYRRFGELQYISIPANEEGTLVLKGLAEGTFTLDIEEVDGKDRVRYTYSAIPSSTSTEVTLPIDNSVSIEKAILEIDYDGDGKEDVLYNTAGVVIEEITYQDLFATINNLGLKKAPKLLLINLAKVAEGFHKKAIKNSKYLKLEKASLRLLLNQVLLFERARLINKSQREEVEGVIIELLN